MRFLLILGLLAISISSVEAVRLRGSGPIGNTSVEIPGPSQALFDSHSDTILGTIYACTTNRYIATAANGGSDSADGTAATVGGGHGPWLTMSHADSTSPAAGTCINVQPGTYSGWDISHGGNLAAPTGYVVYRCAALNACVITGTSASNIPIGTANYVVYDGFDFAASSANAYGIGLNSWNGNEGSSSARAGHHLWAINNKIHGYGQSGVQWNDAEYFYVIHNDVYQNAYVTCDAMGSGITFVDMKAITGYTQTASDLTYAPFKNVISWNHVRINTLTNPPCGFSTDGNGIIIDNNAGQDTPTGQYPNQTLVAFNVTYNNGGCGICPQRSSFVTMANNSLYHNYLSDENNATVRGGIQNSGQQNISINNISVAVTESGNRSNNVPFGSGNCCGLPATGVNTFARNISFGGGSTYGSVAMFDGDSFSCATNKCATNPQWVNVGATSIGNQQTAPVGSNFALSAASPAIGYGSTAAYLSPQSVDAGACYHTLTTCP